ncbi:MAG: RsmE family RNA methyltransferase [Fusobacteriota bacterium]
MNTKTISRSPEEVKKIKTIIIDQEKISNTNIKINERKKINYIKNVLRKSNGDSLRVVDGENEYITEIIYIDKKEIVLQINSTEKNKDYMPEIEVDIALTMLKNKAMNLAIQKLTEIGINKVIPMETKHSVVKLTEKKNRWDRIAKAALKQCQGVKMLEIENPRKINELEFGDYDLVVLPYEKEKERKIRQLRENKNNIKKILYIIGPEGGFTSKEVANLIKKGAISVTLGKRILRAETAAIVTGGYLINEFR